MTDCNQPESDIALITDCDAAGTVLHFAKLDARKRPHNV